MSRLNYKLKCKELNEEYQKIIYSRSPSSVPDLVVFHFCQEQEPIFSLTLRPDMVSLPLAQLKLNPPPTPLNHSSRLSFPRTLSTQSVAKTFALKGWQIYKAAHLVLAL